MLASVASVGTLSNEKVSTGLPDGSVVSVLVANATGVVAVENVTVPILSQHTSGGAVASSAVFGVVSTLSRVSSSKMRICDAQQEVLRLLQEIKEQVVQVTHWLGGVDLKNDVELARQIKLRFSEIVRNIFKYTIRLGLLSQVGPLEVATLDRHPLRRFELTTMQRELLNMQEEHKRRKVEEIMIMGHEIIDPHIWQKNATLVIGEHAAVAVEMPSQVALLFLYISSVNIGQVPDSSKTLFAEELIEVTFALLLWMLTKDKSYIHLCLNGSEPPTEFRCRITDSAQQFSLHISRPHLSWHVVFNTQEQAQPQTGRVVQQSQVVATTAASNAVATDVVGTATSRHSVQQHLIGGDDDDDQASTSSTSRHSNTFGENAVRLGFSLDFCHYCGAHNINEESLIQLVAAGGDPIAIERLIFSGSTYAEVMQSLQSVDSNSATIHTAAAAVVEENILSNETAHAYLQTIIGKNEFEKIEGVIDFFFNEQQKGPEYWGIESQAVDSLTITLPNNTSITLHGRALIRMVEESFTRYFLDY